MKFKAFLSEGLRIRKLDIPTEELLRKIKTECSDILKEYDKVDWDTGIWRGEDSLKNEKVNSDTLTGYVASIRTDRIPVELDILKHKGFNDALIRAGFDSHRGNSIFTTMQSGIATAWGLPCLIFPKNGFKYTWFKDFEKDYGAHYYVFSFINSTKIGMMLDSANGDTDKINQIWDDLVKSLGATNTDLEQAFKLQASEILFSGPGYYAINAKGQLNTILKKIQKSIAHV